MMSINKKKNPAASFMSSFGAKVNKEETKKEAVVEKVVEKAAEVGAVEEKVVLPDMVSMPVDTKEYDFDKVDVSAVPGEGTEKVKKEAEPMEKVVDEAIKEDAKAKEKTVSYNFHIPYKYCGFLYCLYYRCSNFWKRNIVLLAKHFDNFGTIFNTYVLRSWCCRTYPTCWYRLEYLSYGCSWCCCYRFNFAPRYEHCNILWNGTLGFYSYSNDCSIVDGSISFCNSLCGI